MTLSDLQGHSPITRLLKCDFSYSCVPADMISTDIERRVVPRHSWAPRVWIFMSGFLASHLASLLTITKAQRSYSALLLFNLFARRLSHCVLKEFESEQDYNPISILRQPFHRSCHSVDGLTPANSMKSVLYQVGDRYNEIRGFWFDGVESYSGESKLWRKLGLSA